MSYNTKEVIEMLSDVKQERLRDLLAEFSERFPGRHLMIGGNH